MSLRDPAPSTSLFAVDPAKDSMDRSQTFETIGTVATVLGILCILAGIVWAIQREKQKPDTNTNWAGDGTD
jgi:hypothetical protein